MRRFTFIALASACLVAAAADDPTAAVREEFQRAFVGVANAGPTDVFANNDSDALRGYILYPYLEQARIRRALTTTADFGSVDRAAEAFLNAHEKDAIGFDLRRMWYASLAKRQEWERLLANYRDVNDPTLQCQMLTARISLQRFDGLQPVVAAVWSTASESRPACELAFNWLRSQGGLTDAMVESRTRLALSVGNSVFARQLIAMLPENLSIPLESWPTCIERPRIAIDSAIETPNKPFEAAALLEGWIRLVRSDSSGATQRYKPLVAARQLKPEVASRFALELALALSWSRRSEALEYFAKVRPVDIDDRAAEWYARAALWAGDWKRAAAVIEAMSPTLRQQTKWRYWSARVAERRGKQNAARSQYAALLEDDNYYAALAAARLQKPYAPKARPLTISEEQVRTLQAQPSFSRSRELLQLDIPELRASAYDEWRKGYNALDANARRQAIALAARWGWYEQAILTAAQQGIFDDYDLLYPRPFDSAVAGAAEVTKLPATLIYGTLRQESLYRVDALSPAGAKGLMQLTTDTAAGTARRWPQIDKEYRDAKNLFDASTNIYLGTAHLRELVDRYNGKMPLALAAYNAGPAAAERWVPNAKIDSDIWIENIPYNETRIYVQRIFWHSVVFGWLASRAEQNTASWLGQVGGG